MLKNAKIRRLVMVTLTVMLVVSFVLAAGSFVVYAACETCQWTDPSCQHMGYQCDNWDFMCWLWFDPIDHSYEAIHFCEQWCMDGPYTCQYNSWWEYPKVGCCD